MSEGAELTCDGLLDGRVRLWQPRDGYRVAVDPVLLAAFVPARAGERVLELGCGAGAALLCLAARVPGLELHGLELQPDYAALARLNAAENGAALAVHEGDLRRMPPGLRALAFDQVLMNPPFHPRAATGAADPGRAAAHREAGAGLANWLDAGLRRLRPGGWLTLVHQASRLGAILAGLEGRAGGVAVVPVAGRAGRPAGRVLVRARKGSRAPLALYPPFTLHSGDAHAGDRESYSAVAQRVLRGMEALAPGFRDAGPPAGDGV